MPIVAYVCPTKHQALPKVDLKFVLFTAEKQNLHEKSRAGEMFVVRMKFT